MDGRLRLLTHPVNKRKRSSDGSVVCCERYGARCRKQQNRNVVGESAERRGVHIQRAGAPRYTRDYYGVLAAAALARLYERNQEVSVFGNHPTSDVHFRQDLMEVVIADWQVEFGAKERHFVVSDANAFDEPVGSNGSGFI
jgi:hypothetical protein